jgi:hypothetical protein
VTAGPENGEGRLGRPSVTSAAGRLLVGIDLSGARGVLLGRGALALGLASGLRCLIGQLLRPGCLRIGLGLPLRRRGEPLLGLGAATPRLDAALAEPAFARAPTGRHENRDRDQRDDDQDDEKSCAHADERGLPIADRPDARRAWRRFVLSWVGVVASHPLGSVGR